MRAYVVCEVRAKRAQMERVSVQPERLGQWPLSKATMTATVRSLKAFFQWLAMQPGYKSRINYTDTEYFNLSEKDAGLAGAKRNRPFPTLEQVKRAIAMMLGDSVIERRNRTLVAFTLLTGARDSAIASLKLKHVDLESGSVFQDAWDVNTNGSKTFTTYFSGGR